MLSKRFLLIAGCSVAAVLILLGIAVDLYADSDAVRQRLETALSRKAGVPVKVESLHFNLWTGLAAEGVAVAAPGESHSSLGVPRVVACVSWLPLFSQRFQVKRLVLKEPVLVLAEDAGGCWSLPVKKPEPAAGATPEPGIAQLPAQPAPTAKPSAVPQKPRKPRVEWMIRAARVENATLRFVDNEGNNVALLEGVDADCPRGFSGDFEGRLSVRKATFENGWVIEELTTPFIVKGKTLTLPDLQARLGGGTVRGKGTAAELRKDAPFTLSLAIDGVQLRNLQGQIQGEQPACKTAGSIHGSLDIQGLLGRKKSITGKGQLRVHNGRMAQVPLLQMIGKSLNIEELSCLELQQAQLDLRAADGKVYVESLVMESPNLSLVANGVSSWGGKLNLDARLTASTKVTRQLPQTVEANFQDVPGSERKAIAFHINGNVNHPQTDLVRVMVGQKIENELINVFRALTGKPKKKSGTQAEPVTPAADPAASPASEEE